MKRLLLLLGILCIALPAYSQGSRQGDDRPILSVQTPNGPIYSVASATINICNSPANGVPCTNKAPTYTDITLLTQCPTSTQIVLAGTNTCVGTSDQYGNWGVWLPPGTYSYTITIPNGNSIGPYVLTVATGSGSSLIPSNNTWTGTNNFAGGLTINGLSGLATSGTITVGDCVNFSAASPPVVTDSGSPCGGGGGSGSVVASPQYQLFAQPNSGSSATAQGATGITTDSTFSTINDTSNFTKINPWNDTAQYNMRAVASAFQTTATCSSSTSITLASASNFQNGDGIVLYGCGPTNALSTPGAPTVTPGLQSGPDQTVDWVGPAIACSGSASYQIVARDANGGLTAASSAGTTSTSCILGPRVSTVSTLTRANNVVTVTVSGSSGAAPGAIVFIENSTDATFSGEYVVATAPNSNTFTYTQGMDTRSGASTSATGGTAQIFNSNLVKWTPVAGAWEYYIYRGGTLVGVTYPGLSQWADLGYPAPSLPDFVPTSAPGSETNDYLATTICSGGTTTSITVCTAASQNISGTVAKFDNGPTLLAAANASTGATLRISTPASGSYWINDHVILPTNLTIIQGGKINLNETIEMAGNEVWTGYLGGGCVSAPQFSFSPGQCITVSTAYPGFYTRSPTSIQYSAFSIGAQGLGVINFDGYGFNSTYAYDSFSFPSTDFTGQAVVGMGASNTTVSYTLFSTNDTSGYGYSLTPVFLDRNDSANANGSSETTMSHTYWVGRGFGVDSNPVVGAGGVIRFEDSYANPLRTPLIEVGTYNNLTIAVERFINDTSTTATLAAWNNTVIATLSNVGINSGEPGGRPGIVTGNPIQLTLNNPPGTNGQNTNVFYDTPAAASYYPTYGFSSWDARVVATPMHFPAGHTLFWDLPTPSGLSAAAASGGSLSVGTHKYAVGAVGIDAGYTAPSTPVTCTTTSGNQTCNLSWNAVTGATSYYLIDTVNETLFATGIVTNSYSDTAHGCCNTNLPISAGSGLTTIESNKIITPQLTLSTPLSGGISASATVTPTNTSGVAAFTLPTTGGTLCTTTTCSGGGGGGINPPAGDIGGTTGSPTVVGLEGIVLPVLGGATGYFYDNAGTLSLSTSASNLTTGTLPHAQLPTLISADIPNNTANTTGTAGNLAGCIGSSAGDVCYYTGSAWARLTGNASSTQYLQETSSGVPSWTTPSGAGNFTVSSLSQYQTVVGTGTTSGQGAGPGTTAYSLISNGASAYPTFQQVSLTAGVTGLLPNANLANTATTVNTQTCTLGSPCTIPFSVVGSNNSSQNGINFIASTVNAVGLTVTPSNPSSNNVKFEITGTVPGGTVTHSTGNLIQGESVVGSGASVNDVATSPAYLDCSQFSGADWGLIAQACLTALNSLNSTSGVADMRGVSNATTASINPLAQSATLPASGKMLLGAGTWLTNVPIAVHNDWSIEGISIRGVDGQVGTTIKAGASFQATYSTGSITVGTTGASEVITGSGTTWTSAMRGCAFVSPGGSSTANNTFGIIAAVNSATSISIGWGANNGSGAPAASAYDIYCPIYAAGSGGASSNGDQFGMNLTNINLDCNNVAGCVGYMNWYGNQGTRALNVGLHGYTNIGADYEFQAQNFDESSFGAMTPGTSCTTSTIPLVVRLGAESTSGFATLSMNQCPGTVPAVGIDDQTNGLVIRNADLEHVGIGLLIGGNVTCPVACPIGPKVNVQGGVFVNMHCLAGVTTCGQISSAEGTPKNLTFIDMQTTGTNMLIDGPNGNTITAGGSETTLGLYQTGEAGVVVASTSVQANAQPKTLPADAVLIANLPTAATSATAVAVVSNGSTSTDCTTGGGSNYVTCYNTGSAWVPVGGGSGGGGSPGGLTNSVQYNAGGGTFGGLNSPTSAGQYFVQFNVPGSSGVVPTASVGGVVVNAQSSATPSVTQANDTQMVQTTNSTTSTALSIPSASGLSAAFVFAHCNTGSVVATDTPTTSTVNGNPTIKLQGAVVNPSCALFWTDPSFSYWAAVIPPTDANGRISAAGMPAFTGDATTSAGSLAITVTKINGTSFAGTNGDVVSFGASNIPADSGVAVANLTTQTANGAANDVCTYTGTNKLCVPGPVTNAMLSNSSVTVNTQTCTLGSSCTITAGLAFPATVSGTATSGGIPYFSNTTTLTSSALLATNALVTGGGAGGAPATGNGDFTYATHTLTGGASAIFDISAASVTAGLKIPAAAGAAPTADDFIALNTTNHTFVWGSNGTTIVGAAAATGTGTATTCSNQVITAVSSLAIPTCTTITPAYAAGNTTGSGNFVLATSATLVTPALGTPSALVLTNATGTPTSINLTNASALPCSATPALTGAVTTSAGSCATSFQSSPSFTTPNIGAATGTSLLATGIVDGEAPVTVTTGTSATLGGTYNSGYTFNEEGTAATAVTYTLPTAAAGKQYCVSNAYNGSAANTGTLELLTSASGQFIIFTDGTLSATGGFVISGGAARDAACVVGVDSTHWILYVQSGTWAKH